MAFAADNEDRNGDCFILGTEGEPEEDIAQNHVIFCDGMPAATDATVGNAIRYTAAQVTNFVKDNTYYLYNSGIAFADALNLSYIRFLAARNGLISPEFTGNIHHVRFNDAERLPGAATVTFRNLYTNGAAGVAANEPAFTAAWNAGAAAIDKARVRRVFTDIVCCVAYMFRVRAHHYRADFDGKYKALWTRCLHADGDLPVSWQLVSTVGIHAIFPIVLDNFWRNCAANSQCAGALIKRIDSAPAGAAGILALKKGLDDITMIFPTIVERVPESKAAFDGIYQQVSADRWGASINSRYYGVNRVHYNESDIGALASVVVGVYEQLAPNADLKDSMSLQRLAKIAPATGGAIGQAALRTTRSERMTLLPAE
jgi:hypothetical protein